MCIILTSTLPCWAWPCAGANWPLQALKCTQTSSDTSSLQSMVVDNNTTW